MKPSDDQYKEIPISIVGGNKFGRYDKMSSEQTFNMIVSDGWLVPFAGYKNVLSIQEQGQGRGIYSSAKNNTMYAVINNNVYKIDTSLSPLKIGQLTTYSGTVYISENNANEIIFSDSDKLYVYNPVTSSFGTANNNFFPGYITFQDGRFISPGRRNDQTNLWELSNFNDGLIWPSDAATEAFLQTKPDNTVAAIRFPGKGNLLLVFGETVTEMWIDAGTSPFPYQRSGSQNFDFGCLSAATIAIMDNLVCWLGANEASGPVIMFSTGGDIERISTDGIDFKLSQLTQPENSYGMLFNQDGHIIYIITFPADNISYAYDFNTKMFFTLTDEHQNYFIAKRVVFFNNTYYFVSFNDANLYEFSTKYIDYNYGNGKIFEIPRVRICPSVRLSDQSRFIAGYSGFTIEQGQIPFNDRDTLFNLTTEDFNPLVIESGSIFIGGGFNYNTSPPFVELTLSKDGGVNFGSASRKYLNPVGKRQNRLLWWRLGQANDLVEQFRFYGFGRFVCTDGVTGVHL